MHMILTVLCLLWVGLAHADDAAPAASTPRTYALVAAIGNSFNVVTEEPGIGSRLPPYQRRNLEAEETINLLVLHNLDQQVATMSPDSKRILLAFPSALLPSASPARRAQAYFDAVVEEIKQRPERAKWDRILIVTPAYRAQARNGMGAGLQGMGLFIEPLCESNVTICERKGVPLGGPMAVLPDGTTAAVNHYFAPFFFITVWELDAASLNVIEKLEIFDHKLMVGENYRGNVVFDTSDKTRVAQQMVELIGTSLRAALKQTELVGRVEAHLLKDTSSAGH